METDIRQAFTLFDSDSDGYITPEEIKNLISKIDKNVKYEEVEAIMGNYKGRPINFEEFESVWNTLLSGKTPNFRSSSSVLNEEEIREEFRKLDVNDVGYVTKSDLIASLSKFCHIKDVLSAAQRCLQEMDINEDGKITFPEFLIVWRFSTDK